jgi:hypothetical protein
MPAAAVDAFLAKDASLVRLVDSRSTNARRLRELPADNGSTAPMLERKLVDPSQPISADVVIEALASSIAHQPVKRLFPLVLIGAAMTAAAIVACRRHIRATSPPPKR